jgi:hypothetical protein
VEGGTVTSSDEGIDTGMCAVVIIIIIITVIIIFTII